ncbi:hypothetical protein OAF63_01390 [Saprospiraceae bacterium]|jgi:YHS domain-containing protein|nr:hypothetical protein [Saprospiraceae bacterium]
MLPWLQFNSKKKDTFANKNMFRTFICFLLLSPFVSMGQKTIDYNQTNGYIADGYDVTTYFKGNPKEGSKKFITSLNGIKFKFVNQENLDLFNENPQKFSPKYGGWCAYAMGTKGEKVTVNPETYEIRNGELYLFYNAFFTNTLEKWKEEGAEKLKVKANEHWEAIKFK